MASYVRDGWQTDWLHYFGWQIGTFCLPQVCEHKFLNLVITNLEISHAIYLNQILNYKHRCHRHRPPTCCTTRVVLRGSSFELFGNHSNFHENDKTYIENIYLENAVKERCLVETTSVKDKFDQEALKWEKSTGFKVVLFQCRFFFIDLLFSFKVPGCQFNLPCNSSDHLARRIGNPPIPKSFEEVIIFIHNYPKYRYKIVLWHASLTIYIL